MHERNPFPRLTEPTLALDEAFWQHVLAVDYSHVLRRMSEAESLVDDLQRIGRPVLEDLAEHLGESTAGSKQALIERLVDHSASRPYIKILLLTRALVHGVRRDVIREVLEMFGVEGASSIGSPVTKRQPGELIAFPSGERLNGSPKDDEGTEKERYNPNDRVLIAALELLEADRMALRYIRWLERAESMTHHEFVLWEPEEGHEPAFEAATVDEDSLYEHEAVAEDEFPYRHELEAAGVYELMLERFGGEELQFDSVGDLIRPFIEDLQPETIDHFLSIIQVGSLRTRCLDIRYLAKRERVLFVLLQETRRRRIQEFDRVYYGTESEIVLVEFAADFRSGLYMGRRTGALRIVSAIATGLAGRLMQYVPMLHRVPAETILQFLMTLEEGWASPLRLIEIRIDALPISGIPSITLREGVKDGSLTEAIAVLLDLGEEPRDTLDQVSKLRVLFNPGLVFDLSHWDGHSFNTGGGREYAFELTLHPFDLEDYTVYFSSRSAPRAVRERFANYLREEFGVVAVAGQAGPWR